ncbi:hypothetical protein SRABI70_03248 [Pseudomonas sp. Bi70]|nr:hypothetical protein SRABI70_03248 [Pseudomonas sp. Bi70]
MDDRLLELGGAGQAAHAAIHGAFADRFAAFAALDQLGTLDCRATDRALLRHHNRARVLGTTLGDHLHHLGNHVTGAADDHRVADHHPQARHLVHVVQRRVGHRHARHLDRFETRHRRHRAGAANLELHVEQLGELFHGRKLVGHGPMRRTRTKTELLLVFDVVDLEHHAVDVIGQAHAPLADIAVIGQTLLHALGQLQLGADGNAPGLQALQHADLGRRRLGTVLAEAIAAELQRTAGGDLRVQLAQTASRGVAWVGESLAADLGLGGVETFEAGARHEHLTTYFQHIRPAAALQLERHVADGAHVDADVFAGGAIAAGGAAHQLAVTVQQAYRQAVELGLAAVLHLTAGTEQIAALQAQPALHAAVEGSQVVLFEGIAKAQHGHFVAHLAEGAECFAAYALGRRVGCHQFRVLGFKRLQLAKQAVVFGIRHARLVEHVIAVVVRVQFVT